jgi:hypothetical protein
MSNQTFQEKIANLPITLNQSEIIEHFTIANKEIVDFYSSFSLEQFFSKPERGWSPLENIKHLNLAITVVAIFLRKELSILLLLFGRGTSKLTIPEIIKNYNDKLNAGSGAGVFTPLFSSVQIDPGKKEAEIKSLQSSIQTLIGVVCYWTDEEMDKTNILHPIMGIISVREMLYFNLYHLYHHSAKVEARLK